MQHNTLFSLTILIGALSAAGYSCSPSLEAEPAGLGAAPGSTGGKAGSTGATDATGSTGGTAGGSTGGSGGSTGGGGPFINPDASVDDGSTQVDEDAACGTGEASATLKPVNMFVMFDRSWSMNECGDGNTAPPAMGGVQSLDCPTLSRWDLTSVALTQFVQSPEAADINIALRFFPDDNPAPGCNGYASMGGGGRGMPEEPVPGENCDVAACAVPLVNIAPLLVDPAPADAQEGALVAAIAAATPPGPEMPNPNPATPTYAALGGAEQWATAYQTAHPEGQTVVVLITDGEPYGCDTDTDNIARLASDANTSAGVLTYVVGLTGASEAQLDQLAEAGGTQQAYFVSDGNTATAELLAALIAIKGEALACDFPVPAQTADGKEIDPKLVNVNYQSGEAGMVTEFGIVDSLDACSTSLGWYYDNPSAPTRIFLCPEACKTITSDTMARLQVLAGCKPKVVTK